MDPKKIKTNPIVNEKEIVKPKIRPKKEKDPIDTKYARKEYNLKTDKEINYELNRNYKSYIETEADFPDWPSQEVIKVKIIKIFLKNLISPSNLSKF
jgi:hypothetical protein